MGKLAAVQRELNRKREVTDPNTAMYTALMGTLKQIVSPAVTPEELQASIELLQKGMRSLSRQIDKSTKTQINEISTRPKDFIPVLTAIDTLQGQLGKLTSAINGIKIPAPVVNVDKPDSADFTPIMNEIHALRQDVGQISFDVPQQEVFQVDERPKQWSFDVKRKRNGYDITAKAT